MAPGALRKLTGACGARINSALPCSRRPRGLLLVKAIGAGNFYFTLPHALHIPSQTRSRLTYSAHTGNPLPYSYSLVARTALLLQ